MKIEQLKIIVSNAPPSATHFATLKSGKTIYLRFIYAHFGVLCEHFHKPFRLWIAHTDLHPDIQMLDNIREIIKLREQGN